MNIVRDWNEFWFARKSPAPLGLFRVLMGCTFFFWGLLAAPPNLWIWYSERGPVPLQLMHACNGALLQFSIFASVTNPDVLFAYWIALLVFAFLFTIGFCTRISSVILWILFLSFNNRDQLILNGGDGLMRCTLFILLLSPCGKSCSVDRMIAIARGKDPGGDPAPVELWTQRLLQIQLCIVYVATVCSKMSGKDWLNGTAVYYPMHMDELTRFPIPAFFSDIWVINLMTWATLAVEVSLATLIWNRRTRPYVLTAGVVLNSGIEYALNIPLFSMVIITSYLNFVYNEWITNWVSALSLSFGRYRIRVHLPAGSPPDSSWQRVIDRLDVLHLIRFDLDDETVPTELKVSARGRESVGLSAMRRIVLCFPALWLLSPVFLIPGSTKMLTRFLPPQMPDPIPADTQAASISG